MWVGCVAASSAIAARIGEAMHGTKKLRDALGDALWAELQGQPEQLDRIAHIISFFETADTIGAELRKLGLPSGAVDALLVDLGAFSRFKGAGHISALAARSLIPHLEQGLRYDQACEACGWDHAASQWSGREQVTDKASFNRLVKELGEQIANPVARKSLTEGLKQLWAMRNRWGLARPLRQVDPPWGDPASFRREVQQAYGDVFVARPERRRARGEGHAATIRQVKERDGAPVVYERKSITDLSEKRLEDIKDSERNQSVVEAIRRWIADGRPADRLPRSPAGDEIRKVRLRTKGKPSVQVRGGSADRGEIVRVDVFAKPNKRGKDEFYLVPIYPHHVMNKREWPAPPQRAVVAYKDEEEWTLIDDIFSFRFSLYPRSFVEVVKSTGEIFEGYFGGVDRSTGAVSLFAHNSTKTSFRGLGAKTLLTMKKYNVDRFGARSEVKSEVRTWHGVVCTSPIPPG